MLKSGFTSALGAGLLIVITAAALSAPVALAAPAARPAAAAARAPGSASARRTLCTSPGHTPAWTAAGNGEIVRADSWSERMCIRTTARGPDFTVTSSVRRSAGVVAFPDVLYGWSYGLGSKGTVLPARVSALPRISVTWATAGRPAGVWNKALDMWLDARPIKTGQATGGELMIWDSTRGYQSWARFPIVTIDGIRWHVDKWVTVHSKREKWPLIVFNRVHPAGAVHDLRLAPFFAFAEAHHWMSARDYLTSIEAGDEINSGARGLAVTYFSVSGTP